MKAWPASAQTTPLAHGFRRRDSLLAAGGLLLAASVSAPRTAFALPLKPLQFPRDFGSHPDMQTEWWYITGQVQAAGQSYGFQLTFFRSRVASTQTLRSPLAAKQLLFAHVALSDVKNGKLLHDQRMARAGLGLAEASTSDTDVRIGNWYLRRSNAPSQSAAQASIYDCELVSKDFELHLKFHSTQPVLLQGKAGLSRKGPEADQASYYYSQPQLAVSGAIVVNGQRLAVEQNNTSNQLPNNRAWLDHECSDALLHKEAQGWDWIGMNLADGSALTAFQLRRADGSALWTGGSWRSPPSTSSTETTNTAWPSQSYGPAQVQFKPLRYWSSPHSKARYAVDWELQTPQGRFEIRALADDQELDSRASTGAIYWEGLCQLLRLDTSGKAQLVGSGYLEMTGYANAMKL